MSIYKSHPLDHKWCVYLTIYSGNKLPPFYVGSTSLSNISKGYLGSVKSKKYIDTWKSEIKNCSHLFTQKIIKTFIHRKDALLFEYYLQSNLKMIKNDLYINRATAFGNCADVWNKGKKTGQIPWNKGLKGVQVPSNKGVPNPKQTFRMITNNPMKKESSINKQRETVFNGRPLHSSWKCLCCHREKIVINTIKNMKKKFCDRKCYRRSSNKT